MNRLGSALVILLGLSSLLAGCGGDIIDPKIEIPEGRTLIVMPFADQDFANGFDSPRGCELAERATRILKDKAEGWKVKPIQSVYKLYQEGDPRELTAKEVAIKCKADYVLMGKIEHWALQDENTYGLMRGTSKVKLFLYETHEAAKERLKDAPPEDLPGAGKGQYALRDQRVSGVFPQEYGMTSIGSTEHTAPEIEAGLLGTTALQIAWTLVPHTKDEARLAAGK